MSKQTSKIPITSVDVVNASDSDFIDELIRRWNSHEALLEACEGLMEKADNGSADFDDPEPGGIYLKAIAAIAAAKKE